MIAPLINQTNLFNQQIDSTSSAVLYLFSPRRFSQQAKRPMSYNFDSAFLSAASDASIPMKHNFGRRQVHALADNPHYSSQVMPSINVSHIVDVGRLDFAWTFMLLIFNDTRGLDRVFRSASENMHLYYGYFIDEPVNPLRHFGRVTPNPNAQLLITHKTIINQTPVVTSYGQRARLDMHGDYDIVPSIPLAALSSVPVMLERPQDLYRMSGMDSSHNPIVMPSEAMLLDNQKSHLAINAKLNLPKENMRKILLAVADAHGMINTDMLRGSAIIDIKSDAYDTLVDNNLLDIVGMGVDTIGLPTNRQLTLGTIYNQYRPDIQVFDLPHEAQYTPADQIPSSARNVFSSMLASVVPAMMTEHHIADFAFVYDSHYDKLHVDLVSPIARITTEDTKTQVNALIFRLQREIFPILKNRSDFHLSFNASLGGITHVVLNFHCDTLRSADAFEVPTILGGINSPLIANTDVATHNAMALNTLVRVLADNETDIPLGAFDEHLFTQGVQAFNTTTPQGLSSLTGGGAAFPSTQPHKWTV